MTNIPPNEAGEHRRAGEAAASNPGSGPSRSITPQFPIRFTDKMLEEIGEIATAFGMSRQDVIRLAVAAGLKTMRRMGREGLMDAVNTHSADL
jgi:hypothetical protein